MPSETMPQTAKGVLAAVASNVLFAMLFLYSSWMKPMNGTDVFAWRMVGMLFALFALASLTHSWQGALNFAAGSAKTGNAGCSSSCLRRYSPASFGCLSGRPSTGRV